jgi:hypothetical protein
MLNKAEIFQHFVGKKIVIFTGWSGICIRDLGPTDDMSKEIGKDGFLALGSDGRKRFFSFDYVSMIEILNNKPRSQTRTAACLFDTGRS